MSSPAACASSGVEAPRKPLRAVVAVVPGPVPGPPHSPVTSTIFLLPSRHTIHAVYLLSRFRQAAPRKKGGGRGRIRGAAGTSLAISAASSPEDVADAPRWCVQGPARLEAMALRAFGRSTSMRVGGRTTDRPRGWARVHREKAAPTSVDVLVVLLHLGRVLDGVAERLEGMPRERRFEQSVE